MKVAILISRYLPVCTGGAELATSNIARELADMGSEVHIITSLDPGQPHFSEANGVSIHRLKVARGIPFLSSLSFMTRAVDKIGKIGPDIVHTQGLSLGWIGYTASKIYGIPHVTYGRGSDVHTQYRFKRLVLGLSVRSSNAVIALTEAMEKEIREVSDRPVHVIPNGIDLERFKRPVGVDLRDLGIPHGSIVFTFVGTLREVKGISYLIEAFERVHNAHSGIELLLIGGGPERDNLERQAAELGIEDHVHFVGPQPNERIPDYLMSSDIFVLPSLSEGFPLVVLEAMAAGLPIVCTRVGGLPNLVAEGVNGLMVEPRSSEQLARGMEELLMDQEIRKEIGDANLEKVKDYSWHRTAEMLMDIYGSLMTDREEKAPGAYPAESM